MSEQSSVYAIGTFRAIGGLSAWLTPSFLARVDGDDPPLGSPGAGRSPTRATPLALATYAVSALLTDPALRGA